MTLDLKGCDHSTGGAIIGGALRRQGFHGAVRYAAEGRPDVSISASEYHDLRTNGIPVGIVVEHEARWLLRPPSAVAALVAGARTVWRRAGVPDGVAYMAADFDATEGGPTFPGSQGDRNMHDIAASLHAAAGVIGSQNVGFYGSAFAIDWLVKHEPWIHWFWDTEAWSHRRPSHPRAQLYQRASSADVAGVSVDIDVILASDWGQRGVAHGGEAPTPKPKPSKPSKPKKPHPKVIAGTIAGAGATGLVAALNALHGLHLTPAEGGAIATFLSALSAYLVPGGKK